MASSSAALCQDNPPAHRPDACATLLLPQDQGGAGGLLGIVCSLCFTSAAVDCPGLCVEPGTNNSACYPSQCDFTCGFCDDPSKNTGEEENSVSLESLIAAIVLGVLGFALLFFALRKARKLDKPATTRSIVGTVMCILCTVLLIVAQGMVSFDVVFELGTLSGGAFLGFDFWKGVDRLWEKDVKMLSVILAVASGIWPIVKQLMTGNALMNPSYSRAKQMFHLRVLGIAGKTAFLDISLVCIIVSLIQLDIPQTVIQGVEIGGPVNTYPRGGVVVLCGGLLFSRIITTVLIHFWPPPNDIIAPEADSKDPKEEEAPVSTSYCTSKRAAAWIVSLLAAGTVVASILMPALTLKYALIYHQGNDNPYTTVTAGEKEFTMIAAVNECRWLEGDAQEVRTFLSWMTMIFSIVTGPIHSLAPFVCVMIIACTSDKSTTVRHGAAKLLQLLSEWSSYEMLCIGVIFLNLEIDNLAESFSEQFGYDKETNIGAQLTLDIQTEMGLVLGVIGSVLTIIATSMVLADPAFANAF